jgi:hypothetical protein
MPDHPKSITARKPPSRRQAVLLLAVCALCAGGATAAASGRGHTARSRVLTLTSVLDPRSVQTTDVGPKGPSAGDVTVFSAALRQGKRVVGRLEGTTTAADPKYQGDVKTEYLALHGGTIAIIGGGQSGAPGVGRPDSKILDSVVGGTGRYLGARGSVSARDISDTTERITLRLTR